MDEFMDFMGYRNMLIEDKISECLDAAARGETEVTIECEDLTDEEAEYLQREVERRIKCGRH